MGCDMHLFLEKRIKREGKEEWIDINPYIKNNYKTDYSKEDFSLREVYNGRDYKMFSVLADVRNGSPGADDYIEPLSFPKGIPEDCSAIVKIKYEYWRDDLHSASWYLLGDLLEYQKKTDKRRYSGMMTQAQSDQLDKGILPDSWCKWTNRSDYVYRTWESNGSHLDELITSIKTYIEMIWYYDEKAANDYRIVFWFDN